MAESTNGSENSGEVVAPPQEATPPVPPTGPPTTPPKSTYHSLSLQIWPPSDRTRQAVISRLVENLSSSSSVLAKRYGVVPQEVASGVAVLIESEAFAAAADFAANADEDVPNSIDEGIEVLQIYSKEISKRMLENVKARAAAPADSSPIPPETVQEAPAVAAGEEIPAYEVDSPAA